VTVDPRGAPGAWIARLAAWRDRSISNQITAAAVSLTLAVATVIGATTFVAVRSLVARNIAAALESQARLVEQKLVLDLNLAVRDLADLADNSFIANGLVDSQGRDTYLLPFLREHRLPVASRARLVLCDFKGTPIASNQGAAPTLGRDVRGPLAVLASAKPYAEVVEGPAAVQLVVSYPVVFPPTAQTEGVIVFDMDLAALLASASSILGGEVVATLTVNGRPIRGGDDAREITQSSVSRPLPLPEPLAGLGFGLVVGTRAQVHAPLRWVLVAYLLIGLATAVVVLQSSRRMARRLAAPIEALSQTAARVAAGGDLGAGVPVGGVDEVGTLASAIGDMLGKIRISQEELEGRVRERTAELQRREKELQRYAETQAVLLREVNHRVKNNLSAIIGVLHLEEGRAITRHEGAVAEILQEMESRIRSLATVHALLSGVEWQPLPLHELCQRLLRSSLGEAREPPTLRVESSSVRVDAGRAHNLALVLNELATNTLKYGRPAEGPIEVDVAIAVAGEEVQLTYRDHGPGFPGPVVEFAPAAAGTGLQLIRGIVESSLAGTLELSNDGGAVTVIRFNCSPTQVGGASA
jgi:two-component sensor histidine kinase/HAMP domain-containing protein